jgi:hypothetical protein
MPRMTPAELHKLLTDAVMAAHRELATAADAEFHDPSVRRAFEILTEAMDRVMLAASEAYPDDPDVAGLIAHVHQPPEQLDACSCTCHSDGHGHREWPLLTDFVGGVTACSRCRPKHKAA